ncbi:MULTISPECIES: hypothetical protein [Asticcacaulis]|uniref:glycine-rich domain-containing protein n=1 Tax=Asticcacaulis TaxID=76890 RepID=UPI001AE3FF51|nr:MULTISPECIES: hypothetical protein [Asticcacaulis]MBP2158363.1 hypothetical protein [Asticcacaulis solisilvae]MDR6799408.1 hypothetical protein [Asticcacaulis sp. BE141]
MKTDTALWQAINAYDIDVADAVLPFSGRLARDNGWTRDFARRAVAEYKRFIYLACVSGHTVTPSEEIDSVWHLHLIYTRDYWDRFCKDTLKRPVHHGPTDGGPAETEKYLDCYRHTLSLYEIEFAAVPPRDLWPHEAIRFAQSATRQVDTRSHLVLPKRHAFLSAAGALALTVAACSPKPMGTDLVTLAFAAVIAFLLVTWFASAFSQKRRGTKDDGSGCSGFTWPGTDSSNGSSDSSGDGGSGCGGGCGGGD